MLSTTSRRDIASLELLAGVAALAIADLTVPWLLDLTLERGGPLDDWKVVLLVAAFRVWLWLSAAGLLWHPTVDARSVEGE